MIRAKSSKGQFRAVCRWIGIIEGAFDQLSVCEEIANYRLLKDTLQLVVDDLETWKKPGEDNAFVAWHFKEMAYHKISLVLFGYCTYSQVKQRIWNELEIALGRLIEERQALYYFLEEIKGLNE